MSCKTEFCSHFSECASCVLVMAYERQISLKEEFIKGEFKQFYSGEFEIFTSDEKHYRSRAEFGIYHDADEIFYTMNGLKTKYLKIDECPKVDIKISNFMPILLKSLKGDKALKSKLFGAEFIATKKGFLTILLYHKNVENISENLANLSRDLGINLIARSKGKKLVFGSEILDEELTILGENFYYKFESNAFIQPNRSVNEKMISWVKTNAKSSKDLFEMYCGHGNFTIPLSFNFRKVLANEISKSSINMALINAKLNSAKNINFLRLSSEEMMRAFGGEKFRRLNELELKEFDFSHILVDPPRAGLDRSVIEFIKNYENIIYISCSPSSLKENLEEICKTHRVKKFAIFDQFVHTKHIECGVILEKFR